MKFSEISKYDIKSQFFEKLLHTLAVSKGPDPPSPHLEIENCMGKKDLDPSQKSKMFEKK